MNRHVGASFTLSVLVVVFFAVILYEPEHARPTARSPHHAPSTSPSPSPSPTPGVPISEAITAPPPESLGPSSVASLPESLDRPADSPRRFPPRSIEAEAEPSRLPVARAAPRLPAASEIELGSRPRIHKAARRRSLSPVPRSAFTRVAAGESLSDVAVRVYGTPDAANTLWLVNRDLIDRRDAPLSVGMLLRTP
jgi:hypothetical protein